MLKKDVKTFNEESVEDLNATCPFLVKTNPDFFDPDHMDSYGYQKFGLIVNKEGEAYLNVERTITRNGMHVELPTARYSISKTGIIGKCLGHIAKKVVSICKG